LLPIQSAGAVTPSYTVAVLALRSAMMNLGG
jgi:hypothetical protein